MTITPQITSKFCMICSNNSLFRVMMIKKDNGKLPKVMGRKNNIWKKIGLKITINWPHMPRRKLNKQKKTQE